MKKNVSLGLAAASLLGVGLARASVDMAIEGERERNRKAFLDNECAATGQTCVMGPHGPNGEIQCQYCGRELGENSILMGEEVYKLFGGTIDESHGLKSGRMLTGADLGPMNSPKGPPAPGPDEPMPDRFSVNPESPYYDKRWASTRIGVRFDGSDRPWDVEEYCVSEGWIRIQMFMKNGKVKRERGKIVCLKRHGVVEPYRK